MPQWKTLNNLLRETTQSAIITKNVTHYSLTIETNRKKKCYFVLSTIWYCGVNYTCMIIMYKGYTHDSWGHFVNPSSQTHKLPPFVRGSLEWALSWPRFLNEKRVKEVLGVWKMTLYRVNRAGRFWCIKLELKWYIVQFPVFRWYLPLDRTDRVTCKHFILTSVFRELWIWQDLLSKLEPILVLLVLVAFLQIKTWS